MSTGLRAKHHVLHVAPFAPHSAAFVVHLLDPWLRHSASETYIWQRLPEPGQGVLLCPLSNLAPVAIVLHGSRCGVNFTGFDEFNMINPQADGILRQFLEFVR